MKMKRLPRYLRDSIDIAATMKWLLGMPRSQAQAEATDEVAKQAGKINPDTYKPTTRFYTYSEAEKRSDAKAVYDSLMRDPTSPPQRSRPDTDLTASPVTGAPNVRRARRSNKPRPVVDDEPPVTKHLLPLLYTDGQRSGRGTNINHEFSDSPATQTWRQQNQRE